jgi:hypothetical protein
MVELPVADPGDAAAAARLHSRYMLHSMAHWRPLVNGYSGLVPPRHEALFRLLPGFPDDVSLRALEGLGVRYAVVHTDFYPRPDRAPLERRLAEATAAGRLELLHRDGDGLVYALKAAQRAP